MLRVQWGIGALALVGLAGACLADDDACGKNQEHNAYDACVCKEGLYLDAQSRCRPCGQNEVSKGDHCECAPGYVASSDGACEAQPPGFGVACGQDADCTGASATFCQQSDLGGYCTSAGCTSDKDCVGDYACDLALSPSVCVRPPTGQGEPCATQDDCAGKEAGYCETGVGKVCLVSDCAVGGTDCFLGWECCDLTPFGLPTLCVTEGDCPSS